MPDTTVYVTDAFVEGPGRTFVESPGRVRNSGAAEPALLYCGVVATKTIHGVHPFAMAFNQFGIPGYDPNAVSYPASYHYLHTYVRYKRRQAGGVSKQFGATFQLLHDATVAQSNGVPTLDGPWFRSWDGLPPELVFKPSDFTWARSKTTFLPAGATWLSDTFTDYSVTLHAADGSNFVHDETGSVSQENDPAEAFEAARSYAVGFDLSTLGFNSSTFSGQLYSTLARDFGATPVFAGEMASDGSGRQGYNGYDFSIYDGSFGTTTPRYGPGGPYSRMDVTTRTNGLDVLGWHYSSGVNGLLGASAKRTMVRFADSDPLPVRKVALLLMEQPMGLPLPPVQETYLTTVTIPKGTVFVLPPEWMPEFKPQTVWRYLRAWMV